MRLSKKMRSIGWLCFALLMIGMPISLFIDFVIYRMDGEYAWSELPEPVKYSFLTMGFLFGTGLILILGAEVIKGLVNHAVLAKGQPATAKIIRIEDTGGSVNDNPIVRMLLEVYPPDQPPFQAEAERIVSRLHTLQLQPGAFVQVKYDAVSHAVALTSEADQMASLQGFEIASDGKPIAHSTTEWSKTDEILVEREGKVGVVKLLSAKDMGRSQGSAVVVCVDLEVFVPNEEPYKVTKEIFIPSLSLQPVQKAIGKSFPARVHPYDREKVYVDMKF